MHMYKDYLWLREVVCISLLLSSTSSLSAPVSSVIIPSLSDVIIAVMIIYVLLLPLKHKFSTHTHLHMLTMLRYHYSS